MRIPKSIEESLRHFAGVAVENMQQDGYLAPVALLVKGGQVEPVLLQLNSDEEKQKTRTHLFKRIIEKNIDFYIMITEGWAAPYDETLAHLRPSQRADRVETISAAMITPLGTWSMTLGINREDGKVASCEDPTSAEIHEAESPWQDVFKKSGPTRSTMFH